MVLCNSWRTISICFREGNMSFYKVMEVIKWKIGKPRRSFNPTSLIHPLQPFGMRGKTSGRWRICLVIATQLFCSKITSEKIQFSKVLQNCRRIFLLENKWFFQPLPNTNKTHRSRFFGEWLDDWIVGPNSKEHLLQFVVELHLSPPSLAPF